MGFKDNITAAIAGKLAEAVDQKVDGKEIVDKFQNDLVTQGVPAKTIKMLSEGAIFNITCEMQEGLWQDPLALATEWEKRAKELRSRVAATSAAKPAEGKTIPEKKSR